MPRPDGFPDILELTEMLDAAQIPIRLSMVGKRLTWELSPSYLHQSIIEDIRRTLEHPVDGDGCGCYFVADVNMNLPIVGERRPDIAIYCQEPPRTRRTLTIVPQAVIEIVSPGSEDKDYDAAPLYLACGVLDVVLVDPEAKLVEHHTARGVRRARTFPVPIQLLCGCRLTIPEPIIED